MRRVFRVIVWILGLIAVAFVGLSAYIRLAPDDPRVWHVDPAAVSLTGAENEYLVTPTGKGADRASPVYAMTPDALMAKVRRVAMSWPRTSVLGERDGIATFVQRSATMAFPDYISVRAVPAEGGAALYVWSRSRYGRDDFGVNEARVSALLEEL